MSRSNPSSAGINPAWRKAISHVVVSEGWGEGAPAAVIDAAKQRLTSKVNKLEALVPGAGAYFNEVSQGFRSKWFHPHSAPRHSHLRRTLNVHSLAPIIHG